MRLGIFAKTFVGTDPEDVMIAARAAGFSAVQYNMACSGLAAMPEEIPTPVAIAVASAAKTTGVAVPAVSGTYNMIHPDPSVRAAGLRRLEVIIKSAPIMGAEMVTLCTGTRDPEDQWRAHAGNNAPDAWADLLVEMGRACTLAEAAGVRLGVEPELANVVDSAEKARRLVDTLQSSSLAIVLDPANLIDVATPDVRREQVAKAVDLLADRIVMAHAKDRHADGSFATAGTGVIDFEDFFARLRAAGFNGDVVTHGLAASEAPSVSAFLHELLG